MVRERRKVRDGRKCKRKGNRRGLEKDGGMGEKWRKRES